MSTQRYDHVIRHDIQNNPIVREVDQARQRELGRWGVVGVVAVSVVLFSAGQHFRHLQHGYELEELQQELARELEINRHLRLEIETLQSPTRIERIATGQLGFVAPGSDEAVIIERVAPAAGADRSLVAARRRESFDEATGRP